MTVSMTIQWTLSLQKRKYKKLEENLHEMIAHFQITHAFEISIYFTVGILKLLSQEKSNQGSKSYT